MSPAVEAWLARRASHGDQAAFEQLYRAHRGKLRRVAATFATSETTIDDLVQIAALKLWREVRTGRYDPARATFSRYASTVAYQALIDDRNRRRAAKRWSEQAPVALDTDAGAILPAPSWTFGADPALVVIQRDELRRAWQALTPALRDAVQLYLATDGVGASRISAQSFYRARKRAQSPA